MNLTIYIGPIVAPFSLNYRNQIAAVSPATNHMLSKVYSNVIALIIIIRYCNIADPAVVCVCVWRQLV